MQDVYLVTYTIGTDWVAGTPTKEQPGFRAHADYLNALDKNNRLVIGGPLADYSHVFLAIEASGADEVRAILRDDPWQQRDMLRIREVTQWVLLVDPR